MLYPYLTLVSLLLTLNILYMQFNVTRPWDNLPLRLTTEEISQPHSVIRDFFSTFDMPRAKNQLDKWINATCKDKPCKLPPARLLFLYEKLHNLIAAAHLIHQLDNSRARAVITAEEDTNLLCPELYTALLPVHRQAPICHLKQWEDFPRHLTRSEFLNPYKVFARFFKYRPLGQWWQVTYRLFSMGLSRESFVDDCLDIEIIRVHSLLIKLIEAAHLIDVRELRGDFSTR